MDEHCHFVAVVVLIVERPLVVVVDELVFGVAAAVDERLLLEYLLDSLLHRQWVSSNLLQS